MKEMNKGQQPEALTPAPDFDWDSWNPNEEVVIVGGYQFTPEENEARKASIERDNAEIRAVLRANGEID